VRLKRCCSRVASRLSNAFLRSRVCSWSFLIRFISASICWRRVFLGSVTFYHLWYSIYGYIFKYYGDVEYIFINDLYAQEYIFIK